MQGQGTGSEKNKILLIKQFYKINKFNFIDEKNAIWNNLHCMCTPLKKNQPEEKAKVVAAVWGRTWMPHYSRFAARMIWRNVFGR